MNFGKELRKAGLTPPQFSQITGAPVPTVYSWTNGLRPAPAIALWAVMNVKRIQKLNQQEEEERTREEEAGKVEEKKEGEEG